LSLFDPKIPGKKEDFVPGRDRRKHWYCRFDRVFDHLSTQQDVYGSTAKVVLDDVKTFFLLSFLSNVVSLQVLKGYNATVFAYGATGSGKT
jgi:hypothetical protein